jgi:hypothetical protein
VVTPVLSRPAPPSSRRKAVVAEVRVALAVLAAGILLGAVWAAVAPSLARSADLGESRVAVDGLLALLGIGAGVVTAVLLTVLPGPRPALRLGVVLAAATAANVLAAVVGVRLGTQSLGARGVAVLWPLTAAVLTALRTLVSLVISPDEEEPRSPRHSGATPQPADTDEVSGPPER